MKFLALAVLTAGIVSASAITGPIPVTGFGQWSTTFNHNAQDSITLSGTNGTNTLSLSISGIQMYFQPMSGINITGPGTVMFDGVAYDRANVDIGQGSGLVILIGTVSSIFIPIAGYLHITSFDSFVGQPPPDTFWRGAFDVVPIPEPATAILVGLSLIGAIALRAASRCNLASCLGRFCRELA